MPVTIEATAETRTRLRRLADANECTMTEVVRRALALYEAIHDADEVTVTKDGKTKELLLP